MVLTRTHITQLETLCNKKINIDTFDDHIKDAVMDILTHIHKITETNNETLPPSFIIQIMSMIENYNQELLTNKKNSERITHLQKNTNKLNIKIEYMEKQIQSLKNINQELVESSEQINEAELEHKNLLDEKTKQLEKAKEQISENVQTIKELNDQLSGTKFTIEALQTTINKSADKRYFVNYQDEFSFLQNCTLVGNSLIQELEEYNSREVAESNPNTPIETEDHSAETTQDILPYLSPVVTVLNADVPVSPPDPRQHRPLTHDEIEVFIPSESIGQTSRTSNPPLQNPSPVVNTGLSLQDSSPTSTPESTPTRPENIFLIGDSHVRDLKEILLSKIPEKCYIRSFFYPGKDIEYIVNNIKPNLLIPGTQVILFAGTNDVFRNSWAMIRSTIDKLNKKLKNFQVLLILIPQRYDVKKINSHINRLNTLIKRHIAQFPNFSFIDPSHSVQITHYSPRDMLHIERKGKQLLCNRIVMKLYNKINTENNRAGIPNINKKVDMKLSKQNTNITPLLSMKITPPGMHHSRGLRQRQKTQYRHNTPSLHQNLYYSQHLPSLPPYIRPPTGPPPPPLAPSDLSIIPSSPTNMTPPFIPPPFFPPPFLNLPPPPQNFPSPPLHSMNFYHTHYPPIAGNNTLIHETNNSYHCNSPSEIRFPSQLSHTLPSIEPQNHGIQHNTYNLTNRHPSYANTLKNNLEQNFHHTMTPLI